MQYVYSTLGTPRNMGYATQAFRDLPFADSFGQGGLLLQVRWW